MTEKQILNFYVDIFIMRTTSNETFKKKFPITLKILIHLFFSLIVMVGVIVDNNDG